MLIVRVTETHKWHVTGEIINKEPAGIPLPPEGYFKKYVKKEEVATSESGSFDSEGEEYEGHYDQSK